MAKKAERDETTQALTPQEPSRNKKKCVVNQCWQIKFRALFGKLHPWMSTRHYSSLDLLN